VVVQKIDWGSPNGGNYFYTCFCRYGLQTVDSSQARNLLRPNNLSSGLTDGCVGNFVSFLNKSPNLSLAGAASSIARVLSRQKYASICRDKIVCRDKHVFCRDKIVWHDKSFVVTK